MRLIECLRLRVKDIDFGGSKIMVRQGKRDKDRITMLPRRLEAPSGNTSTVSAPGLSVTSPAMEGASRCRMRSPASTPTRHAPGNGSSFFQPPVSTAIATVGSPIGSISTSPQCNVPSVPPYGGQG
ncbi:MAG: hypothetical protein AB1486_03780 [Planctomycetota bacterium]